MMRFLAVLFLLFASPVFGQVQAPDYKNGLQWMFQGGDSEGIGLADQNFLIWHDHYSLIMSDELTQLIVFYKPIKTDIFKKEGEEKFALMSREQPWLLTYIIKNASNDTTVHVFEYEKNSWKHVATFDNDNELKLGKFLFERYGLIF